MINHIKKYVSCTGLIVVLAAAVSCKKDFAAVNTNPTVVTKPDLKFLLTYSEDRLETYQGGEWIWESNNNTSNPVGSWGTMGVSSPSNKPNGRCGTSSWKDNSGNLWLFGGGDYSSSLTRNDLWRYNPTTNNWTWMSGSPWVDAVSSASLVERYSGWLSATRRRGAWSYISA